MARSEGESSLTPERTATLTNGCVGAKNYEVDDTFREGTGFHGVHTTAELVKLLEEDDSIEFDGIVLGVTPKGKRARRLTKKGFLEAFKSAKKTVTKKFRESFDRGWDFETSSNSVGDDYTPLIGGPFSKQLYLHDHLRMCALAFHAYHHDPAARAIVHITRDFTLGRGFRVDSKNQKALALWRAFEDVNALQQFMNFAAVELSLYGEILPWWLPNGETKIQWQVQPGQEVDKATIPRVRLMDPSTVWEIITYPEDITRVLAYQQVFPTQYQMYSAKDGGSTVPTSKFILQQVPADQVMHFTVNRVSNEKRGRSDLYPIFGYLKRLRDTVEYAIVGLAKAAAFSIDTTIDGSPEDIQAYIQDQQSQKTIAPAGSEFVHSSRIKREYQGADKLGASGSVSAFEWCLNMICLAVQIPVSYLGTHLSGGSTKASALVGTEPVAKKFEMRQLVYKTILQAFWDRLMEEFGIEGAECEITFPEIISQDATSKIKNLVLAEEVETIDHETMSIGVAQELGLTNYDYNATQVKIQADKKRDLALSSVLISPLTAKPPAPSGGSGLGDASTAGAQSGAPSPASAAGTSSAVTKDQKAQAARNDS